VFHDLWKTVLNAAEQCKLSSKLQGHHVLSTKNEDLLPGFGQDAQ